MKLIFSSLVRPFAALALLSVILPSALARANHPAPSEAVSIIATDVDGRQQPLDPPGRVTVVMYTNGDLEQQSRDMSKSFDPMRGRHDFHFVRVVDLRGEVAPIARRLVEKQIRKELDKEAVRVKPLYSKNGNSMNPRLDMPTIADFNGNVLGKFGWSDHYPDIRIVVFNKRGQPIKRFDNAATPQEVTAYVQTVL